MKINNLIKTVLTPFGITFASTFGLIWLIAEPLGLPTGWKLWVVLTAISTIVALILIVIRLCIQIPNKGMISIDEVFGKVNDPRILKTYFKDIKTLRIFASGSETYRTLLLSFLQEINLNQKVDIKVLVRDDGSEQRKIKNSESLLKWAKDIDSNYNTNTTIKTYNSSLMLRGMMFDSKSAILGWYFNDIKGTQGQNIPAHIISNNNDYAKKVIDFAIKTFDDLFINGKDVR